MHVNQYIQYIWRKMSDTSDGSRSTRFGLKQCTMHVCVYVSMHTDMPIHMHT